MTRKNQILYDLFYTFLQKGLERSQVSVFMVGAGTNPPWVSRNDLSFGGSQKL